MSLAPPVPTAPPDPLPPEVFRHRRERFLDRLGDAVAIIPSAPELVASRDTDVPYRPSSDLYYLTGYSEPQAVAVLAGHDRERPLTLFVRPRDPEREAWEGVRLGVDGAREIVGIPEVHPIAELDARLFDLVSGASRIYCALGDPKLDRRMLDLVVRARRGRSRSGVGPAAVVELEEILGPMRRVKEEVELERMRMAAGIAVAAHGAARAVATPGVGEWEVEAALEATFRRHGAEGPAFPSIVASGPNATTLHYTSNRRRIQDGDLVLIDAGAEWGMYCSDLTRTFPASGRFTDPQRAVYDIVVAAERAALEVARPGSSIAAVHNAASRVIAAGLLDLGLLGDASLDEVIESGQHRRYFMHQTSHWLGLDVHDSGGYQEDGVSVSLVPGMVLTVEPGLYLPSDDPDLPEAFRGIGVRIEDSVAITETGAEVLTGAAPLEP